MGCNFPRPAWRVADKVVRHASTGKPYTQRGRGITFRPAEGDGRLGYIRCGQCLGCRLDWAADWAVRCEKEAKLWPHNSFITLTYNDDELPVGSSTRSTVSKREWQLFMKRLRKELGEGIRFFATGEYGDQNDRAHYHAILFNCGFTDRVPWRMHRGNQLFRSPTLERVWPYGFSTIGDVNYTTASYVARYVVKKLRGSLAMTQYADREPPFVLMSRRPGIGSGWFDQFRSDVFPDGRVVYGEGRTRPAPRFFVKRLSPEERMDFRITSVRRRLAQQVQPIKRVTSQVLEAREVNLASRLKLAGRPV